MISSFSSLHGEATDRIILKNGHEARGLIVRRDAASITLRQKENLETIDRRDIRRIDDTASSAARIGLMERTLPSWKAIANDLRDNEEIRVMRMLPTGRESSGAFAGAAYIAFVMNDSIELRIYGDPQNPAGLQIGLRGNKAADRAERVALRSFFAGFLTQRSQIAALYNLQMSGGETQAGDLRLAFGTEREDVSRPTWWMAAWNPAAMHAMRHGKLSGQLVGSHGWEAGFFRDRNGNIHPADAASEPLALKN